MTKWKWIFGAEKTHKELVVSGLDEGEVADSILYHGADWPMDETEARLIAAAPETKEQRDELLEAAQEILRDFNQYGEVLQQGDNGEYGLESGIGRLASAIEKAEKA